MKTWKKKTKIAHKYKDYFQILLTCFHLHKRKQLFVAHGKCIVELMGKTFWAKHVCKSLYPLIFVFIFDFVFVLQV